MKGKPQTIPFPAGEDLKVRFDYLAILHFEAASSKPFSTVINDIGEGTFFFTDVLNLLRAGLSRGTGREFTKEEVGELIDEIGVKDAIEIVAGSIAAAFGSGDEEDAKDEDPPKAAGGSTSTSSDETPPPQA